MNSRSRDFVIAAMIAAGLSGCATIFSKSEYPVAIQSQPPGQSFEVIDYEGNRVASGTTPKTVRLDAHRRFGVPSRYSVRYSGSGEQSVRAKVDPWIGANLFIGGIPGLVVDGLTGAMYKLPKEVTGSGPAYASDQPSSALPTAAEVRLAGHEEPTAQP